MKSWTVRLAGGREGLRITGDYVECRADGGLDFHHAVTTSGSVGGPAFPTHTGTSHRLTASFAPGAWVFWFEDFEDDADTK